MKKLNKFKITLFFSIVSCLIMRSQKKNNETIISLFFEDVFNNEKSIDDIVKIYRSNKCSKIKSSETEKLLFKKQVVYLKEQKKQWLKNQINFNITAYNLKNQKNIWLFKKN